MVVLSCKTMQAHEQCWHDVLDSLIIEAPLGMLATAQAIPHAPTFHKPHLLRLCIFHPENTESQRNS